MDFIRNVAAIFATAIVAGAVFGGSTAFLILFVGFVCANIYGAGLRCEDRVAANRRKLLAAILALIATGFAYNMQGLYFVALMVAFCLWCVFGLSSSTLYKGDEKLNRNRRDKHYATFSLGLKERIRKIRSEFGI